MSLKTVETLAVGIDVCDRKTKTKARAMRSEVMSQKKFVLDQFLFFVIEPPLYGVLI
jgi:hypothetical protein